MKLLAFDPGQTTGWARFEDTILTGAGTLSGLGAVWGLLTDFKPDKIVMEGFRLYPGRAAAKIYSSFPEIEVIGVIRLFAELHGIVLIEELASEAKQRYPDDRLKSMDLYIPNKHARDAVRHGLLGQFK